MVAELNAHIYMFHKVDFPRLGKLAQKYLHTRLILRQRERLAAVVMVYRIIAGGYACYFGQEPLK